MQLTDLLPREAGVDHLVHPDPMRGEHGCILELVTDPLFDRVTKGDGIFGWEGDNRLALYLNHQWLRWELWRLEADNTYRLANTWPVPAVRAADIVPTIIQFLVTHDTRRGFNPHEAVVDRYEAIRRGAERVKREQIAEAAERVAWGLRKDLK